MHLDLSALSPCVRVFVVIHVAEQKVPVPLVNDQADIVSGPDGPEILVLRPLHLVELDARMGGVELKIEAGRLDDLLLLSGQARKAVGECVGYPELHGATP